MSNLRRTGRTTRMVDDAIQELFTKGVVIIKDHYWEGKTANSDRNRHIDSVFRRRLQNEHNGVIANIKREWSHTHSAFQYTL